MDRFFTYRDYQEAASFIRSNTRHQPKIGLVLGSGFSDFAKEIQDSDIIEYNDIPHWPASTVVGHSGELHIGRLQERPVMVMRGRAHYYEGHSMQQVTLPFRVMHLMGIQILILTNAAGGLRRDMQAGNLMLISDHINIIGMAGANPLRGPNDERFGPRFPDMTQVYDPDLRQVARKVALEAGLPLKEGVYVSLAGPSFETPADLRFLLLIGADAVGMSTVPEAIVAHHAGIRILGISGISNMARPEPGSYSLTTHEEVLEAGEILVPRLVTLLTGVLKALSEN